MRAPSLTLVAMVLPLVLAGCTGDEAPVDAEEPDAAEAACVAEATGSIDGTVTDATIQPLRGVAITITGANRTTETDADGAFRFDCLEADRRHGLVASLVGYQTAATDVVVRAGETSNVSMVLEEILVVEVGDPVIETRTFEGLMSCSVSTALIRLNPCQPVCVDEYVDDQLPHHCVGGDPNDESIIYYTIPEATKQLILEVVLEPGLTGTTQMVLFTADCSMEQEGGEGCDGWSSHEASSPLRWSSNVTNRPERFNFTGDKVMRSDLWASWDTVPGVFFQARFTLYVTTSQFYEAPEGTTGIPE